MMPHEQNGGVDEYLTLTEAAKLLRVSRWTLYRRIDEGVLTVYESSRNRRIKLVKRSDVERMLTATPIKSKREKETNV